MKTRKLWINIYPFWSDVCPKSVLTVRKKNSSYVVTFTFRNMTWPKYRMFMSYRCPGEYDRQVCTSVVANTWNCCCYVTTWRQHSRLHRGRLHRSRVQGESSSGVLAVGRCKFKTRYLLKIRLTPNSRCKFRSGVSLTFIHLFIHCY